MNKWFFNVNIICFYCILIWNNQGYIWKIEIIILYLTKIAMWKKSNKSLYNVMCIDVFYEK